MTCELHELVTEFANCVAAQNEAIVKGDSASGNRFAKRYIAAFKGLQAGGNEGRDALAVLFSDQRPEVRVMAAAYLLRHCEQEARGVLEAEAKNKGLIAFGAAQTLRRWDEGTWALDEPS